MADQKPFEELVGAANDELKQDALKETVTDEFAAVHAQLAPMIWALAFDACRASPSQARVNAVLNSVLTAAVGFTVAVTPDGTETDSEHTDMIIGKFKENLRNMLDDRENVREQVSQMGNFQGRQLILTHQNNALAKAVNELTNVMLAAMGPQGDGKEA